MKKYGIWEFNEDQGLTGRPLNLPEIKISKEQLWETEDTTEGKVWKWPLHLTRQKWCSPVMANDFNKAFFSSIKALKKQRPATFNVEPDLDARTIRWQTDMLSDYFPGPDAEAIA
ncbi:hypothetical protein FHG64_03175 [Antarcticibacterium flavum]|uniref:Uncharacterized protein n=1 Tax=Antarcticibacterium flavum TaxID=2058175 RepID=A0A5B7WZM6_9FLAO|nr:MULTISPECIES: hypothetical protein [Antarcticibacterium]MCM4158612.1 hypothetical protein [Antarcticibacterium sp. W02-3]QCY68467.1 hypothetical protein FHG64_03175 [Antarcticibacterium flavum]